MLRITKQTDYGIMLLARMSELPAGRVLSTTDAARWSGLSRPMASKILKTLARGSIIESHRGVEGGYSLARPADQTSLAEVIRVLEGPISMVECGADPGNCEHEASCPTRINWARINLEILRALERIPISEMRAETSGASAGSLADGPARLHALGGPTAGEQRLTEDE